jgi:phosphoenolpyruvate carboxylase
VLPLWRRVIERRAPLVLDLILDPLAPILAAEAATPCLQAVSIWFQLTRIIDENAAMRARRATEAALGPAAVEGSFARALTELDPAMTAAEFSDLTARLSVGPTLTAHPTEAKRVTVLEIHRRIYRHLVSLETQRWTPRERDDILADIEGEIDLLWMTGELRIERPTPRAEIEWGLQFFRDRCSTPRRNCSNASSPPASPALATGCASPPACDSIPGSAATATATPTSPPTSPARRLARARRAILSRYLDAVTAAAARLSVTARIVRFPADLLTRIEAITATSPRAQDLAARHPGELFRQALTAIGDRLRAMIDGGTGGYPSVGHFLADLRVLEDGLHAIDATDWRRAT